MGFADPVLHSFAADVLPDDHPLAFESFGCDGCGVPIHAFNNECMSTWVESTIGNHCVTCFAAGIDSEDNDLALRFMDAQAPPHYLLTYRGQLTHRAREIR